MTLNDVIFIESLPKLDLHGYDRQTAVVELRDFIRDQVKLKQEVVVVVHGIGSGVIYDVCQRELKQHKKVVDFKSYYYNRGCTLVQLEIEK